MVAGPDCVCTTPTVGACTGLAGRGGDTEDCGDDCGGAGGTEPGGVELPCIGIGASSGGGRFGISVFCSFWMSSSVGSGGGGPGQTLPGSGSSASELGSWPWTRCMLTLSPAGWFG